MWWPHPVAAGKQAAPKTFVEHPLRILAFGDSEFATNRFLDYLGNRDLLVNSVNWLAREDADGQRPQKTAARISSSSARQFENVFQWAVLWQPGFPARGCSGSCAEVRRMSWPQIFLSYALAALLAFT
jgi:hypothetical protein